MIPLFGSILKERVTYESEYSADELKKDMEAIFLKTKGFHFRPNLAGEFYSENEFLIYPKIELGSAIAGASTTISGQILVNNTKTQVKATITPNPNFRILFWASLVFGLVFYADFFFFSHKKSSKDVAFYFAIAAPAFILALSLISRTLLKRSFINTFKLHK